MLKKEHKLQIDLFFKFYLLNSAQNTKPTEESTTTTTF